MRPPDGLAGPRLAVRSQSASREERKQGCPAAREELAGTVHYRSAIEIEIV